MAKIIPFPTQGVRMLKGVFLSELYNANCPCKGCREFYSELEKANARKRNRERQ